jgi:hypothetical protein
MRDSVIRDRYEPKDPEAEYLLAVARRFDPLFPSGLVDVTEGMALFYVITGHGIIFQDGFVINDLTDINRTIGNLEAAPIVAALDALERTPEWWNDQRFAQAATEDDERAYLDLLERLRKLPGVIRID